MPIDKARSDLWFWMYISRALVAPDSADSALIYLQARNRNAASDLTGYLHREGDHFVQYVEGPRTELDRLRRAIEADPRHDDLRELDAGPVARRRFPGWDMAFTEFEQTLFASHRKARCEDPDIETASAEDILAFMHETIHGGEAEMVRDRLPGLGAA